MAKEVDNVTAAATANMPKPMQDLVAKAAKAETPGEPMKEVKPEMNAPEVTPEIKLDPDETPETSKVPEAPAKRTRVVDKEKNELKKRVTELEGKLATLQNAYNGKCQECLEAQNKYSDLARKADAVAKAVQANVETFYGNVNLILKKGIL